MTSTAADTLSRRIAAFDQVPTVEELLERMIAWAREHGHTIIDLGHDDPHTPVLAVHCDRPGKPTVLVCGGFGDSPITAWIAFEYARILTDTDPDISVAVLPVVDIPGTRANEAASARMDATPADWVHLYHARSLPGEDPEEHLPVDHAALLQPDSGIPADDHPPTPAGSVSLARLLTHIRPRLTISLREHLVGGLHLALSQELDPEPQSGDPGVYDALLTVGPLPAHRAQKLRSGRQLPDYEGVTVLTRISEEIARIKRDDTDPEDLRFTGGIHAAQAATLANQHSLYVTVDLPHFALPGIDDQTPSSLTQHVHITVEDRDLRNTPTPHRVTRVADADGSPGAELRAEPVKEGDDPVREGPQLLPMTTGWMAVLALTSRMTAQQQAYDILREAAPVCAHTDHQDGMRMLRDTDALERLIRSFKANRRYQRQITRAQEQYWRVANTVHTAHVILQARRTLDREDADNPVIADVRSRMDTLARDLLTGSSLTAHSPQDLAATVAGLGDQLVALMSSSQLAAVRLKAEIDESKRALTPIRRELRDMRALKKPRKQWAPVAQQLESAEARVKKLERRLEKLLAPDLSEPPTATIGATEGAVDDTEGAVDDTEGAVDDASDVAEVVDTRTPETAAPDEKARPDEPAADPPPQDAPHHDGAAEVSFTEPSRHPDPDDELFGPDEDNDLDGASKGPRRRGELSLIAYRPRRADLVDNFETFAPAHIQLAPEWGRGRARWSSLRPDPEGNPPLRHQASDISDHATGRVASPETIVQGRERIVVEPVAEIPQRTTPAPAFDIEPHDPRPDIVYAAARTVTFVRRRTELRAYPWPSAMPPAPPPTPPAGGTFHARSRRDL